MDSVLWNRPLAPRILRRAFWCPLLGQEVEVDFARTQWLGESSAVLRCSAFDPPEAVTCGRRCAAPAYRAQWPSALPLR
jgi:hypothetical protein